MPFVKLRRLSAFEFSRMQRLQRRSFGGHAMGMSDLVVRIGVSTFALRAAEAACIEVEPEPFDG